MPLLNKKMITNTILKIEHLNKSFGDNHALTDINWEADAGQFVTLLGPSGCGKSTMLRIIAGLEKPDGGSVFFEGSDITLLPPYKREINTVFQNYALFPHMDVFDNIAFSLNVKKINKNEIKKRVERLLDIVSLPGYEKKDVTLLSGGQQQRVAVARALANEPKILLLDEPLSALDLKLRKEMQRELKRIQKNVGITFIFVTHDQEEALSLSDKIIVIEAGVIRQQGTPDAVYNTPANKFVADFIGESNIFDAAVLDGRTAELFGQTIHCDCASFRKGAVVSVLIRPEHIQLARDGPGQPAVIENCTFMGGFYEVAANGCGRRILAKSNISFDTGESVFIAFDEAHIHILGE
jgi:spermidine/putrescine transport system ATP-binding protein